MVSHYHVLEQPSPYSNPYHSSSGFCTAVLYISEASDSQILIKFLLCWSFRTIRQLHGIQLVHFHVTHGFAFRPSKSSFVETSIHRPFQKCNDIYIIQMYQQFYLKQTYCHKAFQPEIIKKSLGVLILTDCQFYVDLGSKHSMT